MALKVYYKNKHSNNCVTTVENMNKKIKKMSFEEIDEYIENLPRAFMKALRYNYVKKIRPDYIPRHIRERR